jgi:hypothetical protein
MLTIQELPCTLVPTHNNGSVVNELRFFRNHKQLRLHQPKQS